MLQSTTCWTNGEIAFLILFCMALGLLMGFTLHNAIQGHAEEKQRYEAEKRPMAEYK